MVAVTVVEYGLAPGFVVAYRCSDCKCLGVKGAGMGFIHCVGEMNRVYHNTDYRCDCGAVFEIYDDGEIVIDGYTGGYAAVTVTQPERERLARRRLLSLNQKRDIALEAVSAPGMVRATARKHGVPENTVRSWVKANGLIGNNMAHSTRVVQGSAA